VPANISSSVEFTRSRELIRMRSEIERLREENERLAALAYRDALTGLRNRRCFTERLNEELSRLKRNPSGALAVICIDVNDFKVLNDTHGHAAGDAALIAVGRVLESLIRAEDLVCRMGGDEFAVLLPDTLAAQASIVLERIRAHMPALAGVGLGRRGLSAGLASWTVGDDDVGLLQRADAEMYADKRMAKDEGISGGPVLNQFAKAA
jgi:diguanylate cyclase (GGDEF)-like protein